MPRAPAFAPSQSIGPYLVEQFLGAGAFGEVYRVHHRDSPGLPLALKLAAEPGGRRQLAAEHAIAARFDHPARVPLLAADLDAVPPYIVLRYCPGGSLRDRLQARGRLLPAEAAEILLQLLDCLWSAHAAGVVHRDLKPENLLFDEAGRVRVSDFGLGQLVDDGAELLLSLESAGDAAGTLDYMAPEQRRGEGDRRVDLYAAGVILFEMLTGRRPDRNDKLQYDVEGHEGLEHWTRLYELLCAPVEHRFGSVDEVRKNVRPLIELYGLRAAHIPPDERLPDDPAAALAELLRQSGLLEREAGALAADPAVGPWAPALTSLPAAVIGLCGEVRAETFSCVRELRASLRQIFDQLPDQPTACEWASRYEEWTERIEQVLLRPGWPFRRLPAWARGADPVEGGAVATLEDMVTLLHGLKESESFARDDELGCALEQRIETLIDAVEQWAASGGRPPALAGGALYPDAIVDGPTARRWRALETAVAGWCDGALPSPLGAALAALHESVAALERIPDTRDELLAPLLERLESYRDDSARWCARLDRAQRRHCGGGSAHLREKFRLACFPELPGLLDGLERLCALLADGPPPAESDFLPVLRRTRILSRTLIRRAGPRQLDLIDRKLFTLLRLSAEDQPIPQYEIDLLELEPYYERYLAIYRHVDLAALIGAIEPIEEFFERWRPPHQEEDDEQDDDPGEEDDDEDPLPPRQRDHGNWSRGEFLFNAGWLADHFSEIYAPPLQQQLGLLLRAIHRWTAGGRRPAAPLRRACDAFFERADVRRLTEGTRDAHLQWSATVNDYLQLWPEGEVDPREIQQRYPQQLDTAEALALRLRYAIEDSGMLLADAPQAVELHQQLLALELGDPVDAEAWESLALDLPADNPFPEVPDFLDALRDSVRELADCIDRTLLQ